MAHMLAHMAESKLLGYALRALQFLFAIIVIGTDGYAIGVFRGYTSPHYFPEGDFYEDLYTGVPSSWGFLLFCAALTLLVVMFHFAAGVFLTEHAWVCYARVGVEAAAAVSWFAGFIAVAVNIATNGVCSRGTNSCGELKVAVAFGALECLLFMATAGFVSFLVFGRTPPRKSGS